MKLAAVMIARNEMAVIQKCLKSLEGFDEIIVVDTGSTDGTDVIAKQMGAKVHHYPWSDDFASARNFAMSKARAKWCMSIDADHELMNPAEHVRTAAKRLQVLNHQVGYVTLRHVSGSEHQAAWLFQRSPHVHWVGRVHEHLNVRALEQTGIVQRYDKSPASKADPDRNLRILKQSDPDDPRVRFYLGREYFERRQYEDAIAWMTLYLTRPVWLPEIAEAHLTLARSYWWTGKGNEARTSCLKAINCNPDFKEALVFMSEIHFEPWKSKSLQLSQAATNRDVLFVRTL